MANKRPHAIHSIWNEGKSTFKDFLDVISFQYNGKWYACHNLDIDDYGSSSRCVLYEDCKIADYEKACDTEREALIAELKKVYDDPNINGRHEENMPNVKNLKKAIRAKMAELQQQTLFYSVILYLFSPERPLARHSGTNSCFS